jgi:PadR family transcriptional regulator PadR
VLLGIGIGLVGFTLLGKLLTPLIYGVGPTDPLAITAATAALLLVGVIAALLPATRASRTDPALCSASNDFQGDARMSDEAPLGAFEEQVMLAVVHAADQAFGMNVRRQIEGRTGREVAIGAVYATLDRLEAKGLVGSTRPRTGSTSRRIFHVTTRGSSALVETRRMRDHLWHGIDPARIAAPRRA